MIEFHDGRNCLCVHSVHNLQYIRSSLVFESLAELSKFKLFEDFCGCKNAGINDSSYREGPTDNGANGCYEVIQGWPGLVILYRDGVQIVSEPDGRYNSTPMTERQVAAVSVCVLVGYQLLAGQVLVRGRHDLHDVLV